MDKWNFISLAQMLNQKGFQSVDEDPDLMPAYPPKLVEFNGEDICSLFQAGQKPSPLWRSLRKVLFGKDGLSIHMMGSKNSPGGKDCVGVLCCLECCVALLWFEFKFSPYFKFKLVD